MPIQIERRLSEAGRIRIGVKGDRGQPQRLSTFRLTSADRASIEAAAAIWGAASPIKPFGKEGQWEVITRSSELPVLVVADGYSQWYERWTGGGCSHRCDGTTCTLYAKNGDTQVPCVCDAAKRTCVIKTRAQFTLPDLPTLGVWRFETSSIHCAIELPGILDILIEARRKRINVEAILALETRKRVKNGETKIFPVVVMRIRESYRQAVLGEAPQPVAQLQQAVPATNMLSAAPEPVSGVMEATFTDKLL